MSTEARRQAFRSGQVRRINTLPQLVVVAAGQELAQSGVRRFQRELQPGRPLEPVAGRIAVFDLVGSEFLPVPHWPGMATRPVDEALQALLSMGCQGDREGAELGLGMGPGTVVAHAVTEVATDGELERVPTFARTVAARLGRYESVVVVLWLLTSLHPRRLQRLAALRGQVSRTMIVTGFLDWTIQSPQQRAETFAEMLADLAGSDLGSPPWSLAADLFTPGPGAAPLLVGARTAAVLAADQRNFLIHSVAARALELTLLAPDPRPLLPDIAGPVTGESISQALGQAIARVRPVAERAAAHESEPILAVFDPRIMMRLHPRHRAEAAQAGTEHVLRPESGLLAGFMRSTQAAVGSDDLLGLSEVRSDIAMSVGGFAGGAAAAIEACDAALHELNGTPAHREEIPPDPKLAEAVTGLLNSPPPFIPPVLPLICWALSAAAFAFQAAGAGSAGLLAAGSVLVAFALGEGVRWLLARRAEWREVSRPHRQFQAYLKAYAGWLAAVWAPFRQSSGLAGVRARLAARREEWQQRCQTHRREADRLLAELSESAWTLRMETIGEWEEAAGRLQALVTDAGVTRAWAERRGCLDGQGQMDAGAYGADLLRLPPAEQERLLLDWAQSFVAGHFVANRLATRMQQPETVLAEISQRAIPLGRMVDGMILFGDPSLTSTRAATQRGYHAVDRLDPDRLSVWQVVECREFLGGRSGDGENAALAGEED